eukprot:6490312-Amphidinium_carterae.2
MVASSSASILTPAKKASKLLAVSVASKPEKKPRLVEEADSIDGIIKKCVYDNSLRKGWSQDSVTGLVIDGLSIYDRIKRDKRQWLATGEPLMGKTYFRNMKKTYKGNPDDGTLPLVADQSLPLNPRLHSAVVKMKKAAPDRAPFTNFLDCCESLNKREFVGVVRCMAAMEPAAGAAQRRACLSVMKAIARLGLVTTFPDVVQSVEEKMEDTNNVVEVFCSRKDGNGNGWNRVPEVHVEALKVGTAAWEFLEMHAQTWPLVMPTSQVKLIQDLHADSPWSAVQPALVAVCSSSELGRRLFGDKLGELVKEDLHKIVKDAVARIFQLQSCDESALGKIKREAEDLILELPDSDLIPSSFEIEVAYRTRPVKLSCRSVSEYLDLASQAAVKSAAVQTEALQSMPGESGAAGTVSLKSGFTIAEALLAPLRKTREWAVKTMKLAAASPSKNALDRDGKNS